MEKEEEYVKMNLQAELIAKHLKEDR